MKDERKEMEGQANIQQSYVQAVESFQEDSTPLSDDLEKYIKHVAQTGDIITAWNKVQKVFVHKLKCVLDEFYQATPYKAGKVNSNCENEKYEDMKESLIKLASDFESPPFTIQRLCELLHNPRENYTKCEKFMRALEKNLTVVSSWAYSTRRSAEVSEQVNGTSDPEKEDPLVSSSMYNTTSTWNRAQLPLSPMLTAAAQQQKTIPDITITTSGDDQTTSTRFSPKAMDTVAASLDGALAAVADDDDDKPKSAPVESEEEDDDAKETRVKGAGDGEEHDQGDADSKRMPMQANNAIDPCSEEKINDDVRTEALRPSSPPPSTSSSSSDLAPASKRKLPQPTSPTPMDVDTLSPTNKRSKTTVLVSPPAEDVTMEPTAPET